jgi:4-diphosphocytidyl-2-C-methyl-D-erythritol kinase
VSAPLTERAPAKVNLTLSVLGRRADGYHHIESLVVFADVADRLSLVPGEGLALTLSGAGAGACGPQADNLVLKAAQALSAEIPRLRLGRFALVKQLPVAAGLGGGSADAAAALRLLARANGISPDDPRLFAAAVRTGADVPVCLDPRPHLMRGIGEILSEPLALPPLAAVLVNPGVALATKDVFAALRVAAEAKHGAADVPHEPEALLAWLTGQANDLQPVATALQPVIGDVIDALGAQPDCRLARMSGSGATCFGLFASAETAAAAARDLAAVQPGWWVRATVLG